MKNLISTAIEKLGIPFSFSAGKSVTPHVSELEVVEPLHEYLDRLAKPIMERLREANKAALELVGEQSHSIIDLELPKPPMEDAQKLATLFRETQKILPEGVRDRQVIARLVNTHLYQRPLSVIEIDSIQKLFEVSLEMCEPENMEPALEQETTNALLEQHAE